MNNPQIAKLVVYKIACTPLYPFFLDMKDENYRAVIQGCQPYPKDPPIAGGFFI
jgi:hypothetical protein